MKTKSKNTKPKKKKEFRYHKVVALTKKGKAVPLRHPAFVFYERGNIFIYVSITHSKIVDGKYTIKLKKNPNPNDQSNSYRLNTFDEDTKDKFSRRLDGWEIDIEDELNIRDEYKKR